MPVLNNDSRRRHSPGKPSAVPHARQPLEQQPRHGTPPASSPGLAHAHSGEKTPQNLRAELAGHGTHLETLPTGSYITLIKMRPDPSGFKPGQSSPRRAFSLAGGCAITVALWNAPRSGMWVRSLVKQHRPQFNRLRRAGKPEPAARTEDASRYCPVCSQRLESRRCKLICPVCGYYMSCADYY